MIEGMTQHADDRPTDAAVVLDARGHHCPLPVILLARLARELGDGSLVRLLATDPAARSDVPAFCRMRGHELLEVTDIAAAEGDHSAYLVRVSATSAAVAR